MIVLEPARFPGTRVAIDPDRGATVRSWTAALPGRRRAEERLYLEAWADDDAPPDLPGGIPVLFPFAGRVAAPPEFVPGTWRWDGAAFAGMPIHGFAWRRAWEVAETRRGSAEFRLASDAATFALYPFAFTLRLRVSVAAANRLVLALRIRNDGRKPMPCTPGFHPYFLLPAPGCGKPVFPGDCRTVPYDATCTRLVPPPLPPGAVPSGPYLHIASRPFAWLETPGASLRLDFGQRLSSPGVHYWQPYSRPGAPFFCLEPWTAPAGTVNYPESAAPRPIPPGQTRVLVFGVELAAPRRGPSPPRVSGEGRAGRLTEGGGMG